MRTFFLTALFVMLLSPSLWAQQFRGRVYDFTSNEAVSSVLVTNTTSGALWVSDSAGHVAFTAYPGDVITFRHAGYREAQWRIATYNDAVAVGLYKAPIELREIKVLSPMMKLQQEAAFNRQYFKKELEYAGSKPGLSVGGGSAGAGIGMSGLFSELALRASGKKKAYRRFADEMLFLEQMRYADIRYSPGMVRSQTGLDDSAAAIFIAQHPIPDDFVHAASELELKMWIREQYRGSLKADSARKN